VKIVNQEDDKLQTSRSRTLYPRPQEHYFFPPKDLLQRQHVQHFRGQFTKLFT